jgi:hypothetical protein
MDMRNYKGLVLLLATTALIGAGCGDDDASEGGKDSGVDAGPPTPAMCVQQAKDMGLQIDPDEVECACNKCLTETVACNEDPGCRSIVACKAETGCVSSACYLVTPKCKKVIDDLGGPTGFAAALATQLDNCNNKECLAVPDAGGKDAAMMSEEDASTGGDSGADDAGN